jgi:glycosyltransferase involved in cell wall biosynthesis
MSQQSAEPVGTPPVESRDRVSVVIPAYNAADCVGQAIQSALAQTCPPLEIIVVDDGSADRTVSVAESFGSSVLVKRKSNGGPASARNWGANLARGEWIAWLDADDWWAPTKLEKQLSLVDSPEIGLVHTLANSSRPGVPRELTFDQLWQDNWIINSSALIRKSAFREVGGCVDDKALIGVEDYNLWLRIAAAGWRILNYPELLTHYHRGEGLSADTERVLAAELENLRRIGASCDLSEERIDAKRTRIYDRIGKSAFHERKGRLARNSFSEAFKASPSISRALRLAVARAPASLADARRHLLKGSIRSTSRDMGIVAEQSIFGPPATKGIEFGGGAPYLLVVVDAEEEFDWSVVPSSSISVKAMRHQDRAQRLFERHGIVPTYAVDFAVAAQADGYGPLRDYLADGKCEIGAQLHPWINPPIEEELTERNSFPGNLPAALEFEKLRVLTTTIENNFGCRPILYRAGRYGVGGNTASMLDRLGYKVDCSVVPFHDFQSKGGPDFRHASNAPYWFGPGNRLLEIPVTTGMTGRFARVGRGLHSLIDRPVGHTLHLPGVMARLALLDRIRLTPEGVSLTEAKRMTRALLHRDGHRIFVLSYHSPSLEPGNTPYVRTREDLSRFVGWIDAYLEFFFGELGGMPATPSHIFTEAAFASHPGRQLVGPPVVAAPQTIA